MGSTEMPEETITNSNDFLMVRFVARLWSDAMLAAETLVAAGYLNVRRFGWEACARSVMGVLETAARA